MLPRIQTILYATALEPRAAEAFRYAMSLAQHYEANIVLVHALEPLGSTGETLIETYVPEEIRERLRQEGHSEVMEAIRGRLEEFCEAELSDTPECQVRVSEIRVLDGQPAQVILSEADRTGTDLIVMGSHAHSAVAEVLLGTTAHRVVQQAKVPVLLVRVEG